MPPLQDLCEYFLVRTHGGYPVVQNGRLLGIVTLQCVRALPRDQWNNATVGEIIVSCERAVTVQPEAAALDAMAKMARQKVGRLLVTGKEGQLQGMLTRRPHACHTGQNRLRPIECTPLGKMKNQDDEVGRAERIKQCVPSQMLLQGRLDLHFRHDANNPFDLDSILDD
jgi:hypothetical protein